MKGQMENVFGKYFFPCSMIHQILVYDLDLYPLCGETEMYSITHMHKFHIHDIHTHHAINFLHMWVCVNIPSLSTG